MKTGKPVTNHKNANHPVPARRRPLAIVWGLSAIALAIGAVAVAFRDLNLDRLLRVLMRADWMWLLAMLAAVPVEQLLRAWKWRQILYDIRPVGTLRLFGAVMAGYFANVLVPVGVSPLVRAWLVARLEGLGVSTVLLTTAIERFIDGIVFAVLIGVLLWIDDFPDAPQALRPIFAAAGLGGLLLFAGLLLGVFVTRHRLLDPTSIPGRGMARLERAFNGRFRGLGNGIASGIVWPRSRWRGIGVVLASLLMKGVSTTHFLWVGLAFGIVLPAAAYLFIMLFAGFSLIISRFVRIPGGGVIGAAFALKLLGVPEEEALAMVTVVHVVTLGTIVAIGAAALWRSGVGPAELRRIRAGR